MTTMQVTHAYRPRNVASDNSDELMRASASLAESRRGLLRRGQAGASLAVRPSPRPVEGIYADLTPSSVH